MHNLQSEAAAGERSNLCRGPTAAHSQKLVEQKAFARAVGPYDDKRYDGALDLPKSLQALLLDLELGVALNGQHHGKPTG